MYGIDEMDALLERKKAEDNRLFYVASMICATVFNLLRDPHTTSPRTPEDFMPQERQEQTLDEQLNIIRQWAGGEGNGR